MVNIDFHALSLILILGCQIRIIEMERFDIEDPYKTCICVSCQKRVRPNIKIF